MRYNGERFGKIDPLNRSLFIQSWEDSNINPPPIGDHLWIANTGARMITNLGQNIIFKPIGTLNNGRLKKKN